MATINIPRLRAGSLKLKLSELTDRRRQIVRLVADGLGDKEIAERLGIAENTVTRLLGCIFDETGTWNRASLISHFFTLTEK